LRLPSSLGDALRPIAAFGAWMAIAYLGARAIIPGLNFDALRRFHEQSGSSGGLLGLYDFLGGGELKRGSLLALSILPYLSACAFIWLLRQSSSSFQKWIIGRKGRTTWILTAMLAVVQAAGYAAFLQRVPGAVVNPGPGFLATTIITLTSASLMLTWALRLATVTDEPEHEELPPHGEIERKSGLRPGDPAGIIAAPPTTADVTHSSPRVDRAADRLRR
jgi:hypothetical protein